MSDSTTETKLTKHFIPISKQEIIADLLAAPHGDSAERKQLADFCSQFMALYHYKFYAHLEELKRCYLPFNPDADTVIRHNYSESEQQQCYRNLIEEIHQILDRANYQPLTVADINHAMTAASYYGVETSVELDDFAEMIIYYRGSATVVKQKRTWNSLFLAKKTWTTTIYNRLFLLLKFKTAAEIKQELVNITGSDLEKRLRKRLRQYQQTLPENSSAKYIFIKLFKDIPLSDLEMLFPNQKVRLKLVDKIQLGVTGGGGIIAGIVSVISKASLAVTNPIAFIGAFLGLIGIIFRQVKEIFNQRTRYMMTLSRNLYFLNLDNNWGVISYLIDMAEEEEAKEAILAYYFLYTHADKNYTKEQLDQEVENYLNNQYGVAIDFDIDDGLRKLRQEGLLREVDGILKVVELPQACQLLDEQWDNLFMPQNNL